MNDKDINQKVKETKKFRLHSILKLHTRIMNQKLMNHAMGLQKLTEKLITEDKLEVFNQLVELNIDFSIIGKHNFDVSEMANKLQLSSSQDELEALFKLVTKSEKDIKKELVKELEKEEEEEVNKSKCSCSDSKTKSTEPNTKQVKAKVIEIVASSKEEALEKFKELVKEGKIV